VAKISAAKVGAAKVSAAKVAAAKVSAAKVSLAKISAAKVGAFMGVDDFALGAFNLDHRFSPGCVPGASAPGVELFDLSVGVFKRASQLALNADHSMSLRLAGFVRRVLLPPYGVQRAA
jgi:hypothetical protein